MIVQPRKKKVVVIFSVVHTIPKMGVVVTLVPNRVRAKIIYSPIMSPPKSSPSVVFGEYSACFE